MFGIYFFVFLLFSLPCIFIARFIVSLINFLLTPKSDLANRAKHRQSMICFGIASATIVALLIGLVIAFYTLAITHM